MFEMPDQQLDPDFEEIVACQVCGDDAEPNANGIGYCPEHMPKTPDVYHIPRETMDDLKDSIGSLEKTIKKIEQSPHCKRQA